MLRLCFRYNTGADEFLRRRPKDVKTIQDQIRTAETRPVLETDHLSRVVSGKRLVDDITIGVQKGEVLAVVGPSGSGKSSFLRLLNRLDEPTSGTVYLEGTDYRQIPPRELRRRVGLVTQTPYLFPAPLQIISASVPCSRVKIFLKRRLPFSWIR